VCKLFSPQSEIYDLAPYGFVSRYMTFGLSGIRANALSHAAERRIL
jgi:hypothetical protein